MTSARCYYRFSLGLGAAGLLTLLTALAAVPYAITPVLPTTGEIAVACRQFMLAASGPAILVTVLASIGASSGVCALRTLVRHHRSQRRLLRRVDVRDQLRVAAGTAHIYIDERPQAFCSGLLRPRIYVSTGAVRILSARELDAVVAHEAHHAAQHDPLRILLARVLRDALFFLPLMRHVTDRYGALAEMAADEAAVQHCGDRAALASAMLTFDERAPAGTVGIAPERVDHLLGQPPQWQLSLSLLAAGIATLAALAALGAATAAAVPAGGIATAVLIGQLCMVVMALAPVLGGAALILTIKRAVRHLRRG
ncbi:MAG: M56 family metallopeptidase [Solirubrobacteraceae bacterium]|nr:M56 family metallopeptidase [Solirubrobacteraceae bacterium]